MPERKLTKEHWRAIVLKELEGMLWKDIAAEMGISTHTLRHARNNRDFQTFREAYRQGWASEIGRADAQRRV